MDVFRQLAKSDSSLSPSQPADEEQPVSVLGAVVVGGGALVCLLGPGLFLGNITGSIPDSSFPQASL